MPPALGLGLSLPCWGEEWRGVWEGGRAVGREGGTEGEFRERGREGEFRESVQRESKNY